MNKPVKVCDDIYLIGGSQLSHPYDCQVYLIDSEDLLLIDSGAGLSFTKLIDNIEYLGFMPEKIKWIIATHRHIDHIGSLYFFQKKYNSKIVAHADDSLAIENGSDTAAEAYGIEYFPCKVNIKITGSEETLFVGNKELKIIHIPGHTSGSIVVYIDMEGKRILFGQDIHGPYRQEWGADINKAKKSLQKLLNLRADILCEGHFGIIEPANEVENYILEYLNSL